MKIEWFMGSELKRGRPSFYINYSLKSAKKRVKNVKKY